MSEYINRASLINNLNTFAPEKYDALINDLILKEPAADVVERKKWIPVTERLPETEDHVLAATQNKKGTYNIVKAYYCHDLGTWAAGMNSNVTHWMPLPEPPKEEI